MMKKIISFLLIAVLLFSISACSGLSKQNLKSTKEKQTADKPKIQKSEENNQLQMKVNGENGQTIVFQLNESPAANALYEQLPLSTLVENYSHNEKIFYPPDKLDTRDTPLAKGQVGTLAYYAPWGDVVLFYGDYESSGGLYALGEAVSGVEQIESLSGEIQLEQGAL